METLQFIIGIDPSITKTGVVIFDCATETYEPYLVSSRGTSKDPGRMRAMVSGVVEGVGEREFGLVAIEHPTPKQHSDVNSVLYWMLRAELAERHTVEVLEIYPATLAKFATGNGKAKDLGANIERKWGHVLPCDPQEDIIDALALVKLGQCFLNRDPLCWSAYEVECATLNKSEPRTTIKDTETMTAKPLIKT